MDSTTQSIAKAIFAGAGLAALAASQNEMSAHSGTRYAANCSEAPRGSFAGAKNAGQAGGLIGRTGRPASTAVT